MAYALDKSRFVYVNLGEHDQLKDELESTLIENGFDKKKIIYEPAKRFARKDDYAVEIVRNKDDLFLDIGIVLSVENLSIITQKELKRFNVTILSHAL